MHDGVRKPWLYLRHYGCKRCGACTVSQGRGKHCRHSGRKQRGLVNEQRDEGGVVRSAGAADRVRWMHGGMDVTTTGESVFRWLTG